MRFLLPIVVGLYLLHAHYPDIMPMPSLSASYYHDAAHHWGWKWIDGHNQEMRAKGMMRWTYASCGAQTDVRFHIMKKFGPGKHKCSQNRQAQRLEDEPEGKQEARAKDGRPILILLECNQVAAKYACHWMRLVVDNVVHMDESFVAAHDVMRWQCFGCTTTYNGTYHIPQT